LKAENADIDYQKAWYHGSPVVLRYLMVGSTITQDKDLTRVDELLEITESMASSTSSIALLHG
jgi:hypothetical protein